MFYFLYTIIIFSLNKEKDNTGSAYYKFSRLGECQPHFYVIFVQRKHTC